MSDKTYYDYMQEQEEADRAEAIRAVMANPLNGTPAEPVPALVLADSEAKLRPEAFHGPAGEVVRMVEPHTEADAAGVLIQLLLGFGNAIGRTPFLTRGPEQHFTNLYVVLVGDTSLGRKGSAWSMARYILKEIDPDWVDQRVQSGLSSGEGLIHHVRDAVETEEAVKDAKTKFITGYQKNITDQGVADKRLLVIESEFGSVLRTSQRDGNILSAVMRQAWDTGDLRVMTKNSPARSTGAHVSIVGHITPSELSRYLISDEVMNGFCNRFIWMAVRRSKSLPHGGELHTLNLADVLQRLRDALGFSRRAGEVTMDPEAKELWEDVYERLTCARPGLLGSATCRAAPQVLRISTIYALLDKSGMIRIPHLAAGLEIWRYSEESARGVFGDSLGDSTADSLLRALRNAPKGITRKGIVENVFKRNKKAHEIERALQVLSKLGLASPTVQGTTETWFASSVN